MEDTIYLSTNEEKQEYLAYKSEKDFFDNLESGLSALKKWEFTDNGENVKLIAGAMVAFDKGSINFINELARLDNEYRYLLLSEVTAEFRRKTDACINFEHICTPHLLADEIYLTSFPITVTEDMKCYVNEREYLLGEIDNLNARHNNLGEGYALAICYYADQYIRSVLEKVKPRMVVLWNEFYVFHDIFRKICNQYNIEVQYLEFGCIPGTFSLEEGGQQGESVIARDPNSFNHLQVSRKDLKKAVQVCEYIYRTQINRNLQPPKGNLQKINIRRKAGRPVIMYMGQNDYESGMYPYTDRSKRYHSPIFKSTLDALEFLSTLALKNDWNLVYKPHPIVELIGSEAEKADNIDCVKVSDVDIHEIIDVSDVVVTILSQTAYEALLREKPVVMMGYIQLKHSGCTYEAFHISEVEEQIKAAVQQGYTKEQKKCFIRHVARLCRYYLYDDMQHEEFPYGRKIGE